MKWLLGGFFGLTGAALIFLMSAKRKAIKQQVEFDMTMKRAKEALQIQEIELENALKELDKKARELETSTKERERELDALRQMVFENIEVRIDKI